MQGQVSEAFVLWTTIQNLNLVTTLLYSFPVSFENFKNDIVI